MKDVRLKDTLNKPVRVWIPSMRSVKAQFPGRPVSSEYLEERRRIEKRHEDATDGGSGLPNPS